MAALDVSAHVPVALEVDSLPTDQQESVVVVAPLASVSSLWGNFPVVVAPVPESVVVATLAPVSALWGKFALAVAPVPVRIEALAATPVLVRRLLPLHRLLAPSQRHLLQSHYTGRHLTQMR